jgi:hypothetical protein
MINYKKIMSLNPTVYDRLTNTLGQVIELVEHPVHGDETTVVCVCHELELADYSTFYETDDMMADHKEYEPAFIGGDLYMGEFKVRD